MRITDSGSRGRWVPEKARAIPLAIQNSRLRILRVELGGKKEIWVHVRMKECGTAHGLCVSSRC
jgi:hypothetical protein